MLIVIWVQLQLTLERYRCELCADRSRRVQLSTAHGFLLVFSVTSSLAHVLVTTVCDTCRVCGMFRVLLPPSVGLKPAVGCSWFQLGRGQPRQPLPGVVQEESPVLNVDKRLPLD